MIDEPVVTEPSSGYSPPETVAEQIPPQSHERPDPEAAADPAPTNEGFVQKVENYIADWPKTFFHPVHGARQFKDPNEHAQAGSDWRFSSSGEADAARTGAEADLVLLKAQMSLLADHEANAPVARYSAQAEEAKAAGYPEPGMN
jgi:hypothetical protein